MKANLLYFHNSTKQLGVNRLLFWQIDHEAWPTLDPHQRDRRNLSPLTDSLNIDDRPITGITAQTVLLFI